MDLSSDQRKLDHLPIELLEIIVSFIPGKASLKSISSVSSLFRQLCAPSLFESLYVGFSTIGLNRLLEISNSQLARYVKIIHYEAPALVDPLAGNWDMFCACLYTPDEFAWDRRNLPALRKGRGPSYSSIFSYFCLRCKEQQEILQSDQDTRALVTSLPCFPNFHTLQLSFVDGVEEQFEWLANRMLLDGHSMFPNHLERLLTAIAVARERDVTIRSFEICGFYSRTATEDQFLKQLATEALQNMEELRLVDSPALLPFLNRVPFPRLCRVELASCWLSIPALEEFVQLHTDSLRFLHLEDTWVLVEESNNDGIHLSAGSTKTALNRLASLLSTSGILLTMD
ncbi:hypothetical protein BDV11DRAFT_204312 [Aspergillus similis]